jgi:hypothetical protein
MAVINGPALSLAIDGYDARDLTFVCPRCGSYKFE